MTINDFARTAIALAALAYAASFKRVGRSYLVDAILALAPEGGEVVSS